MSQFIIRPLAQAPFTSGSRELNPLPQPGNRLDGRQHEDDFALYPSTRQVTTITLLTSTATADITTLTVTPTLMATGAAWPDDIGPVSIAFVTAGTQTLAAVAAGLEAAATAQTKIATLDDLSNYDRIRDIVLVTSSGDDVILTARLPGASFTFTLVTDGNLTSSSVTTGTADAPIRLGTVIAQGTVNPNGSRECANAVAGDTVLGIALDSNFVEASSPGDAHKFYLRKAEVLYAAWGSCTVYAESSCAIDAQAYFRTTAAGTEINGALTDTPDNHTQEVITITPTAVNDTLYGARLTVTNMHTGVVAADGFISMTSDGTATATEIVTGLVASLAENVALSALITPTGTATMIMTQDAGFELTFEQTEAGTLADVTTTAAASDHDIYVGAKFLQTTTAAGIAALVIAHSAGE